MNNLQTILRTYKTEVYAVFNLSLEKYLNNIYPQVFRRFVYTKFQILSSLAPLFKWLSLEIDLKFFFFLNIFAILILFFDKI